MNATEPAVEVFDLVKCFGDFVAVDRISFSVSCGEIFGFLGPNGSGKTTTIRMLLGLLKPTEGQARVLGFDIRHQADEIRKRIGYMSQKFSLYNDLTVIENLNFFGRTYGVHGERLRQRKAFVLEMANLKGRERELTRNLAGGWKQRLALGAAILHEPAMLFLDEPTAGVDPVSRRAFWDLLYQLADGGTTILVTTHYMDEAEHCHRLAFIHRGKIVAQGTPEEVKRREMRGQVLEIDCDAPGTAIPLLRQTGWFDEVALYGAQIHAVGQDVAQRMEAVQTVLAGAGVHIQSLTPIAPSLEDVFIASVTRPSEDEKQSVKDEGRPGGSP